MILSNTLVGAISISIPILIKRIIVDRREWKERILWPSPRAPMKNIIERSMKKAGRKGKTGSL